MQVFVTTYAIGNTKGFATGKWFDLSSYYDKDAFLDDALTYCVQVLGDNDPEICFPDHDDIPKELICEWDIDDAVFEITQLSDNDREIVNAYVVATGCDYSKALNNALDNYIGEFQDYYDLGVHFADEGALNIPDELVRYFDFEKYGKDIAFGLTSDGTHYFYD